MSLQASVKIAVAFLLCLGALPAAAATEDAINGRMSGNWSGYVAAREKYTGVGATWAVPTVAASSTLMTDVAWVGIGGTKTRDLIQAGTHGATQNGKVQYWAWYELLPDYQQVIPLAVSPGERVSVDITEISKGLWFIAFVNRTTGGSYYKALDYRSRYSSAEWIEEMPAVYDKAGTKLYAPLSEFAAVTFEDAYAVVDGKRLTLEEARARAVTLVSKQDSDIALAIPSAIAGEDTFTVTRSEAVPSPAKQGTGKRNRAQPWEIAWSR